MNKQYVTYGIAILALAAIIGAGALYAQREYTPPEPPPVVVNTQRGPVVLEDEEVNAGDLITAPDIGTVYYLNEEKTRVVFPDEQTFLSWYPDFDDVKHVSREKLESFPLSGRNATIRPGTLLITIPSSPQVWMIGHPSTLHWLQGGEEQAIALFGKNWTDRLVDLPEYYFSNYQDMGGFDTTDAYPVGLLVHVTSNDQYYIVTETGQRQVTEEGFIANHLQKQFAIEREDPIDFADFGPPLDSYEAKWGSPDLAEQEADEGPEDVDIGGAVPEVG
jgi:hypothetical protein